MWNNTTWVWVCLIKACLSFRFNKNPFMPFLEILIPGRSIKTDCTSCNNYIVLPHSEKVLGLSLLSVWSFNVLPVSACILADLFRSPKASVGSRMWPWGVVCLCVLSLATCPGAPCLSPWRRSPSTLNWASERRWTDNNNAIICTFFRERSSSKHFTT